CLALLGIEPAVVTQSDMGVWTLSHDESRDTWVLDHPWHEEVTLRQRYFWAIHTKLMLEFLLASHAKGTLHSAIYGLLGGGAAAVTDGLYHSVREHIGTSKRDGEVGLVAMAAQWKSYVARIDFCCEWVKALFPALAQNEGCAAGIRTRLEAAPPDLHKADFFTSPLRAYFGPAVPRGDRALSAADLADELTKRIVRGTQGEFR
ncbi:MAG: hypothetical protein H6716_23370, partial [Polyangiaceae bacterium]|nr:hypothetical protein [Polyangiaceae bacterium]